MTVVSDDGKRTEKVQIAPAGKDFLARRDRAIDDAVSTGAMRGRAICAPAAGDVKEQPPAPTGAKEEIVSAARASSPISTSSPWRRATSRPARRRERATFELFVRNLPHNRNFILAAGLAQAVEYLLNLRFTAEEIDYLRGLPQFQRASPEFFEMLAELRFTGDLFAVPEGTPLFRRRAVPHAPRAAGRGADSRRRICSSTIGFQSLIATKAARVVKAALGREVVEFGTRRAHSPEAGVLAGRAAYIGGCAGTSNAEAGLRYGVPVFGTAAHSWVMSFTTERAAFEQLQKLLGESTVYLIDTYDTLEGARRAAALGSAAVGRAPG